METPTQNDPPVALHRLVRHLFAMLDRADDLLSSGDALMDGWPAAREWHAEYEALPLDNEMRVNPLEFSISLPPVASSPLAQYAYLDAVAREGCHAAVARPISGPNV